MSTNLSRMAPRSPLHSRLFTILNVLGLTTGLACSILIIRWVINEWSYDRFNTNIHRTYRITASLLGETYPLTGAPLGAAVRTQIPGVKYVARLRPTYGQSSIFTADHHRFEERDVYYADPDILKVFTFPLVSGDPSTALIRPDGLLLTQRMARKFFGDENALGKTICMGGNARFTVTGVLKDIPRTSHLQFDILLPMSFDARIDEDITDAHWDNLNFYTYLVFDDNAPLSNAALAAVERNIGMINKKGAPSFDADFRLQPLDKVHLYSKHILYDVRRQGDITYVRLFSILAVLILLMVCINFMNLTHTRSAAAPKQQTPERPPGQAAAGPGRIARSSTLAASWPAVFN